MEEVKNLTQDDVLDLIKEFPIQPMYNNVLITLNTLEVDGNLVLSENEVSDVQYVVAVGPTAQIDAGQKVLLDVEKLMVTVGQSSTNAYEDVKEVKLDRIQVNGNIFAFISDRAIKAKDNR